MSTSTARVRFALPAPKCKECEVAEPLPKLSGFCTRCFEDNLRYRLRKTEKPLPSNPVDPIKPCAICAYYFREKHMFTMEVEEQEEQEEQGEQEEQQEEGETKKGKGKGKGRGKAKQPDNGKENTKDIDIVGGGSGGSGNVVVKFKCPLCRKFEYFNNVQLTDNEVPDDLGERVKCLACKKKRPGNDFVFASPKEPRFSYFCRKCRLTGKQEKMRQRGIPTLSLGEPTITKETVVIPPRS